MYSIERLGYDYHITPILSIVVSFGECHTVLASAESVKAKTSIS